MLFIRDDFALIGITRGKIVMNELELEVYIKENVVRMKDYLLNMGKIETDRLGNIKFNFKHLHDEEVEVFKDLSVIGVGYPKRKQKGMKELQDHFTEKNILALVSKFDNLINQ